jgi:hypothetical protein
VHLLQRGIQNVLTTSDSLFNSFILHINSIRTVKIAPHVGAERVWKKKYLMANMRNQSSTEAWVQPDVVYKV